MSTGDIKLGYHPSSWVCHEPPASLEDAIRDIAATGWDGFEYAGRQLLAYHDRPGAFSDLLDELDLELSSYYHVLHALDPAGLKPEIEEAREKCAFLRAVKGPILLLDGGNKEARTPFPAMCRAIANAANEIGRIAADHGVRAIWHQHHGTLFEQPQTFDALMDLLDPRAIGFCPDTAQLARGGFDVEGTVRKYLERIEFSHFKDLSPNGRFIELGCGTIDFPAIWALLEANGYSGWLVTDLDYTEKTPLEASAENKRYYNEVLGLSGRRDRTCSAAT